MWPPAATDFAGTRVQDGAFLAAIMSRVPAARPRSEVPICSAPALSSPRRYGRIGWRPYHCDVQPDMLFCVARFGGLDLRGDDGTIGIGGSFVLRLPGRSVGEHGQLATTNDRQPAFGWVPRQGRCRLDVETFPLCGHHEPAVVAEHRDQLARRVPAECLEAFP